jgi:hypothetical protein
MDLVDISGGSRTPCPHESCLLSFMLGHLLDHQVFIGASIQLLDSTVLKLTLSDIG